LEKKAFPYKNPSLKNLPSPFSSPPLQKPQLLPFLPFLGNLLLKKKDGS